MFTLINDMWKVQNQSHYENSINIPHTIILLPQQPLQIQWYFTGNHNKILRRTDDKVSFETVLTFFKKYDKILMRSHKTVATVTQTNGFDDTDKPYKLKAMGDLFDEPRQTSSVDQLNTKFMNISDLSELLIHYQQYPHLIDKPIVIQQYLHDQQQSCSTCQTCIKVTWNPNYDFIQQCNENSDGRELFITNIGQKNDLKLSPHFREQINQITKEIVQKIQLQFITKRGKLLSSQLIFKVHQDRPYFMWCIEANFEKEITIRSSLKDDLFWRKAKNFSLVFNHHYDLVQSNNLNYQPKPQIKLNLNTLNNEPVTERNQEDQSIDRQVKQYNHRRIKSNCSLKTDTTILESFRSQSQSHRIKLNNLTSIVKSKPFQEKMNKNRSRSFCRLKTNQDSIILDQSYDSSSFPPVHNTRYPLSSRLNNQSLEEGENLIDKVCKKPSFHILQSITEKLQNMQEIAILKETNQLIDNKQQLKFRIDQMKLQTNRSILFKGKSNAYILN